LVLIGLLVFVAPVVGQEGVDISIDKIVRNDHISGRVSGLTSKGTSELKVIVYVKTDKWYIHPYKSGGDGKSFASIETDGSWKIETVRRDFAASQIAALVVERSSRPPSPTSNVSAIPNRAVVVNDLSGTDDFGKL